MLKMHVITPIFALVPSIISYVDVCLFVFVCLFIEKTFCLEMAEKRLFTPPIRSCYVKYSMRPQYNLSHRIVAQIKPKSPNRMCSEALTWRKQHQHQRLLSSHQRSSSPPLQPQLRRSEPTPMHPNATVCSDFLFIV